MKWLRAMVAWFAGMVPVSSIDRERDVRHWRSLNPGRCMYCAYTRWANDEQGQSLKLELHDCPEDNGPPAPLPVARAL